MRKKLSITFALAVFSLTFLSAIALQIIHISASSTQGIVTLTFDDNYLSVYENAVPLLESYGYQGVIFTITSTIFSEGLFEGQYNMKISELMELHLKGWDVQSHTVSHPYLPILSEQQIIRELSKSYETLDNCGFKPCAFAYPYGGYSSVSSYVSEYYQFGRTINEGLNELPIEDQIYPELYSVSLDSNRISLAKEYIRQAKDENNWLIFCLHGVVQTEEELPPPVFGWVTVDDLREILDEIKRNDLEVKTFNQIRDVEKDHFDIAMETLLCNLTFYDEAKEEWLTEMEFYMVGTEGNWKVWNIGVALESNVSNDVLLDFGVLEDLLSITMMKLAFDEISVWFNGEYINTLTDENPTYTLNLEI